MSRIKDSSNLSEETKVEIAKLANCGISLGNIADTYADTFSMTKSSIQYISNKRKSLLGLEELAKTDDEKFVYSQQVFVSEISDNAKNLIENCVFSDVASQVTKRLHEPTFYQRQFLYILFSNTDEMFPTKKDKKLDERYMQSVTKFSHSILEDYIKVGNIFLSIADAASYLGREAIAHEAKNASFEEKTRRETINQQVKNYLDIFDTLPCSHEFNNNGRYVIESNFGLDYEKKTKHILARELNLTEIRIKNYIEGSLNVLRHKIIKEGYAIK